MAANGNILSEKFRLQIPEQFLGSLEVLASANPDYDLSEEDLLSQSLTDQPVYKKLYIIEHSRLLEDKDDITGSSVIRVMGGGAQIGQIRREDISHVHTILANYEIVSTEISVTGGSWKKVSLSDDGTPSVTEGESSPAGSVTIYYAQKENAPAPADVSPAKEADNETSSNTGAAKADTSAANDEELGGWIDTSYVTELREKNPADYGMTLLFFSAVLSVCYLCFALPCWITGRSAEFFDVLTIGGLSIKEPVLLFHLITLGGGLICNIIGIFLAGSSMPALAALLYAFSGLMLPGYVLCAGVQSLLCVFAALRKRKGLKSVKAVLIIAALALLSLEIYQFVNDEILFNPFGEPKIQENTQDEYSDDLGDEEPFMDDIYYMDETDIADYWDADAEEAAMEADFLAQFEGESDFYFDDEEWDEENGVIDMGFDEGEEDAAPQLPSPLGGASGLAGISSRP